jgi:F-type H+-transporting ATPase subunit epsilon
MARAFKLSVVAPDRTVFEDLVEGIIAPAHGGYMGVQAGHEAMIVALKPGVIEFTDTSNLKSHVSTMGGFMGISHDGVIILADEAQLANDIDVREAEAALERARRALRGEDSSMSSEEAVIEIQRATVRLKAARSR